jgi:hypothetical protein
MVLRNCLYQPCRISSTQEGYYQVRSHIHNVVCSDKDKLETGNIVRLGWALHIDIKGDKSLPPWNYLLVLSQFFPFQTNPILAPSKLSLLHQHLETSIRSLNKHVSTKWERTNSSICSRIMHFIERFISFKKKLNMMILWLEPSLKSSNRFIRS